MKPDAIPYCRYRMEQAEEALRDAERLLEGGSLRATVNRLYYACFYAVSALLLTEDHYSRKHSGTEALFVRHWISPGRLPVDMGRFYRHLFKHRQQGDYAYQVGFESRDVEQWLAQTRTFIQCVEQLVIPALKSD